MPSTAVQNPPAPAESKSAKKKKAKVERTESPAPSASAAEQAPSTNGHDAQGDSNDSPYVRELQKNIRNLGKKLANAEKTESIAAQHKDKTLDQLVAAKIINLDQKAQITNKVSVKQQIGQLEAQLAQYKKVDEEYRTRGETEKAALEKDLTEKLEKQKADALSELAEKAAADVKKIQRESLLVLSQFLRLAAARRSEDVDASLDENMALEGVLLNVYSGDENAVATMLKLIEGSEEKTRNVSGEELQTTFAQVKAVSLAHGASFASTEPTEPATESSEVPASDPTVIHAGLTEIDTAGTTAHLTNGHVETTPSTGVPANADVGDGAANAAAESQWDNTNDMSASQEGWVEVPRDPAETETGLLATPAGNGNVQSWADDQPEPAPEPVAAPADNNDGFHQVQRNRPRGHDREGSWRGGGRGRGGYRGGRGFGGNGRGRGGAGGRGGSGVPSRPRRNEESS